MCANCPHSHARHVKIRHTHAHHWGPTRQAQLKTQSTRDTASQQKRSERWNTVLGRLLGGGHLHEFLPFYSLLEMHRKQITENLLGPVSHTCNPSHTGGCRLKDRGLRPAPSGGLSEKITKGQRAGGVPQVIEQLCCKCEILSSNPSFSHSPPKKEEKKTNAKICKTRGRWRNDPNDVCTC
jgi:hypothetical protein